MISRKKRGLEEGERGMDGQGKGADSLCIIGPGLHKDLLRAGIAEPEIVHQRARPDIHPVPAPKLLFAHERVQAPVPVVDVTAREVPAQVILLDPVELKVAERFAVPAADGGEAVLVVQGVLEKGFLGLGGAGDAPGGGDAGLVHPIVQQVCVAGVDVDVA